MSSLFRSLMSGIDDVGVCVGHDVFSFLSTRNTLFRAVNKKVHEILRRSK